jgi:hypothetical protein
MSKNVLDAILNQYEHNKASDSSSRSGGGGVDLTKYFSDKLRKGEKTGEKTCRILPAKDGSPFVEAHWHEMQVGGQWRKLYSRKLNDGEDCPLHEAEQALLLTGREDDRKLARVYRPRKWYVLKVIDRDAEDEGVKFWRFRHNYKGEGVFDKLIALFKKFGDITDPREGRDVSLMLSRSDKGYSIITAIIPMDKGLLTSDKTKAETWLNDTETYKDVYRAQPIEYLEIVARQETPVWDKENKGFTTEEALSAKQNDELEAEFKTTDASTNVPKKADAAVVEDDDELPF